MLAYIEVMLCGSRCGWPGHQLRLLVPVAPRRPRGLRQVDTVMTSDIDHSTAQAPEKQLTTKELLWSKTDPKSIQRGEKGQNRGWGFKTGWSLLFPSFEAIIEVWSSWLKALVWPERWRYIVWENRQTGKQRKQWKTAKWFQNMVQRIFSGSFHTWASKKITVFRLWTFGLCTFNKVSQKLLTKSICDRNCWFA